MTAAITDFFAEWTGGRDVPWLGTNDGAPPIAFQSWHHFKEAFAPELVARAIRSSPIEVARCIDPFGGSGTTALTCQMLGVASTTVEVNPFLADVIRAKLARYDCDDLVRQLAAIRRRSRRAIIEPGAVFPRLPTSFIEPGTEGRWIFSRKVAGRLGALLSAIDQVSSGEARRLFRVILGGMLVDVSNVTVSGKGRRYRRNWEAASTDGTTVEWLFARRCEMAILDAQRFASRPTLAATVVEGDARAIDYGGKHDLAVFSPPYPNSFDYTDVYNVQLWMLGYLCEPADNRALRMSTLSSHVQLKREYSPPPIGSLTLDCTISALAEVRANLWSPWLPNMIGAYFKDLSDVLTSVLGNLNRGGTCWLVVGNSRYAGVTIQVDQILRELALSRGWQLVERSPIRHMKSSAQQGWTPNLAECLLVFKPQAKRRPIPSLKRTSDMLSPTRRDATRGA